MTPLDNTTAAFECLWDAKRYLLRAADQLEGETRSEIQATLSEVAHARNRLEKLLIVVQEQTPSVPRPPTGSGA